jgi:hypothetical protein
MVTLTEIEHNWSHWFDGGTQRGALVGPIPIAGRVSIVFGGGFQFSVAPSQTLGPTPTPEYQSNIVFSGRIGLRGTEQRLGCH